MGRKHTLGVVALLLACSSGDRSDDAGGGSTGELSGGAGGAGAGAGAGAGGPPEDDAAGGGGGTVAQPGDPPGADAAVGDGDSGAAPSDAASSSDPDAGSSLSPPPGEYGELDALLYANSEMAVAELDGIIYVVGGYPSSRTVQTSVQAYDTKTGAWSEVEPLPVPIHHPVVVAAGGKLYSLGGQTAGNNGQAADIDLGLTLVYDPAGDEGWLDLAPDPPMTPRGAGAGAVIGDQIYVVGGRPPADNAFEVYDIADNSWQALAPLPQGQNDRNHLAAAAIDGKIYVAGGRYDSGSFTGPITDALEIFDPATGEWSSGAPLPRPRGGVNGIAAFGCFHVFGGESISSGEPNNVFPDHDVYDPGADRWTSVDPLPVPVHGVTGAAFVDGLIYMPGGGTSSGGSSGSTIFQIYRPALRCD